ncbi:oligosaccharide flippase family protein [Paenibacillus validus]|uniref:oligosaccharide flippase family protein n=1 Tax=Paenibacillus validus TaxID=44253 RepID=UPI000FDACBB5|nr:oligosaccharide flippase family protein [Paenibacillus validus]MED4601679.1 oligosaccharide flippase family protein [Paenibacillus validus]MED4606210.1 oligosaccharide flippase family protein [Paenibacillus validus]
MSFLATVRTRFQAKSSLSNTIRTTAISMVIVLLNLGTGIICARYLGPEGRGEQSAMMLWPSLLGQLVTLGLHSSVIYNMKKFSSEKGGFFNAACLMNLLIGLLVTGAGIVLIPLWLHAYSAETIFMAQLLMFFAPSVLYTNFLNAVLQGEEDFKGLNRRRYLPVAVTLIMLAILAVTGYLNPFYSALCYFIPNVPIGVYTVYLLYKRYKRSINGWRSTMKRLLTYGLSSYLIDVVATLTLFMDQLVLIRIMKPAELGLYLVALSLAKMAGIFQSSITLVLLPKAAGLEKSEIIGLTKKVFRIAFSGTLFIALIMMAIAPMALIFLYGSKYEQSTTILWILLLETVMSGAVAVLAQTFMAIGKPGRVAVLQCIGLCVSLPLLVVWVPKFGITGAAFALFTATMTRFLLIMIQFPLSLKVSMPMLFPVKADIVWFWGKFTRRKNLEMPQKGV